ncbi:hypothetical protein HY933_01305 [Candidatus Falkowbacteria bacterium]|nr:hypothetical protein [Candidatus Falkowbacteria bacterium]
MSQQWLQYFWHQTWYRRLLRQVGHFLHDHFIPHQGNGHLPKALRTVMLRWYAIFLITVKVLLTVFLFVVYPSVMVFGGKISDDVITLANTARQDSGISMLQTSDLLTQAAQAKADDMAAKGYFSHTAPNGDKPWVWLNGVGYQYYAAGENLAMDFSSGASVHLAFMNSPSHRKNIMNPRYREIGVGVSYGKIEGRDTAFLVEYFGSTEKYQQSASIARSPVDRGVSGYEQALTEGTGVKSAGEETVVQGVNQPYAVSQTVGTTAEGQTVLELNEESAPVVVAVPETSQARDIINTLVMTVDRFFYAFMIFLIISLALKIFIQIHIQHHATIGYTISLILLVGILALTHFHFVERLVAGVIRIV